MKKILVFILLITSLSSYAQPEILIPYRVGNKWGYSDTLGKLKIPARYDAADLFNHDYLFQGRNLYATARAGENIVLINQKGKEVIAGPYRSVSVTYIGNSDFFFVTNKAGKVGVRSLKGQLIPPVYDAVYEVYDSGFVARKGNYDIRYNLSGKIIWQNKHEDVWLMKEDMGIEALDESTMNKYQEETRQGFEKKILTAFSADRTERIDSITENGTANLVIKGNQQAVVYPQYYYSYEPTKSFFSRDINIRRIIINTDLSLDYKTYKTRAFIIADSAGKVGIMNDQGSFIFPAEYDNISLHNVWRFLDLEKHAKHGIFIFNTIYPPIMPVYDSILERIWITAGQSWNYGLFKVKKNGKEIYVGENRVEFYKNQ